MKINFEKYQGTGNDFVMIDNRNLNFDRNNLELVRKLCDRRFGIGADGLIVIEPHEELDFEMIYFNSDGSQSFCGNGSRCAVSFAKKLGIISSTTTFLAIDGIHDATVEEEEVCLKMGDVSSVEKGESYYFINTGSPHYIEYEEKVADIDLVGRAQKIRYNDRFSKEGTNVNFVQVLENKLLVRTYERGVEDETYSCGTGVTAVAISAHDKGLIENEIAIGVKGGNLNVRFVKTDSGYENIWLEGPGNFVFSGTIESDEI